MAIITSPQVTSTIDPTQGLIDYVGDIKPYHSKILDVLIEYVYTDHINAVVQERWEWVKEDGTPGITFADGTTIQTRALPYAINQPVNIATYDAVTGGSGYAVGVHKNILLTGGTGTGAKANITVSNGVIRKLYGIQIGSGYAPGPSPVPDTCPYLDVQLLGGTGTGAKANITVSTHGTVSSVILTHGGTGYSANDTLTIGGGVALFTSLSVGAGYTDGVYTKVQLTGGSGVGAQAQITVISGAIYSVTITAAGIGYLVNDVLTASNTNLGGTGVGFNLKVAATSGTLFGITVPSVNGIANGVVTFVEITDVGRGYSIGDLLTVPDASLSGATAGVAAGSFVVGYNYTITMVGTTNFTLIGAASNTVGVVFTATGAGTGTGTATTAPGSKFVVRVKSSDLHAATTISDILVIEVALILYDSISASLVDIRPVGYGLDTYSTNVAGGFGTDPDPDGLSITAIGTGNTTFTGSISGNILTVVSGSVTGSITYGVPIQSASILPSTTVVKQLSGTLGGGGTYEVSVSQTIVSPEPMALVAVSTPILDSGFDTNALFDE